MKPPFAYYGGKTMIADAIVDLMPPHEHYVEPFAGSLAVLLAKPRARMETVNDLDGDLMCFWRVLRDRPEDLTVAAALTPHARGELETAKVRPEDLTELERARRVWVMLTQSRSSSLRVTGWRYYQDGLGSSVGFPRYLQGYVDRMPPAAERLQGVTLECRDGLDVARDYGRHASTLLYVDPPYLRTSRNSYGYRHEMGSAEQHEALAEVLRDCQATVVLSGYASPLYEDLYAGWHQTSVQAFTGNGTQGDGARTEVLWSNVPLAQPERHLFSEVSA